MASKQPEEDPAVTTAPDPEEDDLDDLDDVLDSFQPTKSTPVPSNAAPSTSGPGRPATVQDEAPPAAGAAAPEDFTKQIQASMANLMSELDSNPDMQAEFEKMMQELISADAGGAPPPAAAAAPSATKSAAPAAAKKDEPVDFQSQILKTMNRINASDTTASTSAAAGPTSEEDLLAAMMKELGGGEGGGEGDFNSMLMNMMAHLTNKEILYEPMKELHDKFPDWMAKNEGKEKKEDLERYKEQQKLVGEIVGRFERKGYSDDNEADREFIVERMQKVSLAGWTWCGILC